MPAVIARRGRRETRATTPIESALADFQRRTGIDYLAWLQGDPKAERDLKALNRKGLLQQSDEQLREELRLAKAQEKMLEEMDHGV